MYLRSSILALAGALAVLALPQPVQADAPAIDAFNAAFAKVTSYTYKLHAHETQGSASQSRVYDYSFLKPHFAKTLIESGDGAGSGAVWTGGDQVSGHQGGILSGIHLKVDLHDGRATSLRGYTIPDGLLQNVVANYSDAKGKVHQAAGGKIDGVETDVVVQDVADPASNGGITKREMYFSQATHFPVREIAWVGTTIVLDQSVTDLNLSANLTQDDFPF